MPLDILDLIGMLFWIVGLSGITLGFTGLLIYGAELAKLLWHRWTGLHRS